MTKQKLNIGLFGYGCVGSGLYEVLKQTPALNAEIKKICVKHPDKKRNLPSEFFTYDKHELLDDPDINVIVELIDNADDAYTIVTTALRNGKAVVTANKKLLAEHFHELYLLQLEHGTPLLYEASVGGSIPIIRSLEEYYDNDTLSSIEGILNGTTNYILTQTAETGKGYDEVLAQAQQLGFAETDPKLDVQAYDPKFKLSILLAHAFGVIVKPEEILNYGIHHLNQRDLRYAEEKGYKLKLIAQAHKTAEGIRAYTLPRFVKPDDAFYNVHNEFNAIQVSAAFSDKQLLKGKGAGSYPTAAAVLSDISALSYDYRYGYKKLLGNPTSLLTQTYINVYLRYENNNIFELIRFSHIEEEFVSASYKYVIGKVLLSDLLEANLNERDGVFLAEIPDATFTNQLQSIELEADSITR